MSTDSDISVELTGDDYDQLVETADDLANQISALPDAINVESSAGEQTPRVAVKINRENASRFGLNAATIGGLVRGELTGSTANHARMNGEEYDVTVAGDEDVATSLTHCAPCRFRTMTGGTVPLSMVADVYTELSPQSIVRKNQKETVTITGESESGDSNAIKAAVDDIFAKYELPDGVEVGEGDTAASQIAETTGTLMLAPCGGNRAGIFHSGNAVQLRSAADCNHADPADWSARLDDPAVADRKSCFHGRTARCYHSGRYSRQLVHRVDRLYPAAPSAR